MSVSSRVTRNDIAIAMLYEVKKCFVFYFTYCITPFVP